MFMVKSAKYKGCICETPAGFYVNMASGDEQLDTLLLWRLMGAHGPELTPVTEPTPVSSPAPSTPVASCISKKDGRNFPASVFGGAKYNIYSKFCDIWVGSPGQELKMTVDANGNNKSPVGQLSIRPRVAPQEPGRYMNWGIDLGFKPSEGGKECAFDCMRAFKEMKNGCSNGGLDGGMETPGSIDVGCGVFDYNIIPPPTTPLELQERHCYSSNDVPSHQDIHASRVEKMAQWACLLNKGRPIRSGDKSNNINWPTWDGKQPILAKVFWKEGCILENGLEMDSANPLSQPAPVSVYCDKLLVDNYKMCNNGGIGGYIQAGCLVFDFIAKHDA
ncbi:hypothetical protein VTL71DRAFT_3469 [Oculimacula yallundae]|uniref:Uncharacterized protein n=1 Tax=Oculimacula yallundae TaxID=86028 RepID=A0ABR4C783_9HELO